MGTRLRIYIVAPSARIGPPGITTRASSDPVPPPFRRRFAEPWPPANRLRYVPGIRTQRNDP